MPRTLSLQKETLTELVTDDLRAVVAAGTHITCSDGITGKCFVIDRPAIASVDSPCNTI